MELRQKRVLITGITGQDGSFLAEYLLELGVLVIGLHRRTSTPNFSKVIQSPFFKRSKRVI